MYGDRRYSEVATVCLQALIEVIDLPVAANVDRLPHHPAFLISVNSDVSYIQPLMTALVGTSAIDTRNVDQGRRMDTAPDNIRSKFAIPYGGRKFA